MKPIIVIGILIVGIIGAVAVFASIPPNTWQDNRTTFQGDTKPDENKERIDCMSRGGEWDGSCSIEKITPKPQKTVFGTCAGTLPCMVLTVSEIIDGDTIYADHHKIRLSLTNTPEKGELGFQEATLFTAMHCPVGSTILVDQDDLQPVDIYGRILGKVYCEDGVINEMLLSNGYANILTQYCDTSEFSGEYWAQNYGCKQLPKSTQIPKAIPETPVTPSPSLKNDCDPSYPDFCIPYSPPDLDCKDIPQKRFTVLPPDPHRFDVDNDGIGCES
ncbi:thermonuclease family protein [Nitrosarchaeum koreense]|uniref:Excalibur domain protein n=1 Tax=Nitrosarchaeum koreense MY1 TaxID=1001994 RepID=F9CWC2_9ARCH|nr:thermonuclease family protein [Nitrosarchaeum koreense]EGP93574.1 Excalibur domain protein [Nitrosarchaeum koreense MY1]